MQNDAHTRLSNTALSVVAKDLETHQVSIHKVKSMTEYPDRMPYSCKKRLAKLSMDHRGGKAKVCARLKNIKCRTVCRVCCFCVKKKKKWGEKIKLDVLALVNMWIKKLEGVGRTLMKEEIFVYL